MSLRTRLSCLLLEARDNPSDIPIVDPVGGGSTPTSTDPAVVTPPDTGSTGGGAGDVGAATGTSDPSVNDIYKIPLIPPTP